MVNIIKKIIRKEEKERKVEISFIVVDFNTYRFIEKLYISIKKKIKKINYQIIIITNIESNSKNDLEKLSQKNKIDLIVLDKNVGFGVSNNIGVKYSKSENLCFINPDIEFFEEADSNLSECIKILEKNKNIGIVGAQLLNQDRTIQLSWGRLPIITINNIIKREEKYVYYPWIIGAFYVMKKSFFKKIGEFNSNIFMYAEDLDLCLKVYKNKKKIVINEKFKVIHYGGASLNDYSEKEKFKKKYYLERKSLYYVLKSNYSLLYANYYFYIRFIYNYVVGILLNKKRLKEISSIYQKVLREKKND